MLSRFCQFLYLQNKYLLLQRAGTELWDPMPLCAHLTLNSDEYLECYVRHSAATSCFLAWLYVDVVVVLLSIYDYHYIIKIFISIIR